MNIHIVAKRALLYAFSTFLLSFAIAAISFSNNFVTKINPNFPIWPIPVGASLVSVLIGIFVWERIRETEKLKYEFINNVTHKFRTPLTHIKWLAEELRNEPDLKTRNSEVEQIQYSAMRLFELTNILIDVAKDDNDDFLYRFTNSDVVEVIKDIIENHKEQTSQKNLSVSLNVAPHLPQILIDVRRLGFAIQILFENSIIYTPKGGNIKITVGRDENSVLFTIEDSGIGIAREEIPRLFSKFYRARNARLADTEGMGLGLFMAKSIIEKHGGKVYASSRGQGLGSKFIFNLPIKHV